MVCLGDLMRIVEFSKEELRVLLDSDLDLDDGCREMDGGWDRNPRKTVVFPAIASALISINAAPDPRSTNRSIS